MEAGPGGDVKIQIRVMHAVQAPERRHGVDQDVLQIDGEVQDHHRPHHRQPAGHGKSVEQTPAVGVRGQRHADGGGGEQDAQDARVEDHDADVVRPPH